MFPSTTTCHLKSMYSRSLSLSFRPNPISPVTPLVKLSFRDGVFFTGDGGRRGTYVDTGRRLAAVFTASSGGRYGSFSDLAGETGVPGRGERGVEW